MDFVIFIFYSVPEMLLIVLLSVFLAGRYEQQQAIKYFIAALFLACVFEGIQGLSLAESIRLIIQLLVFLLFMILFFRIPIIRILTGTVITLLLLQATEIITIKVFTTFAHKDLLDIKKDSLLWLFMIWPNLLILSLTFWLLYRKKFSIFKEDHPTARPQSYSIGSYLFFTFLYIFSIIGAEFLAKGSKQSGIQLAFLLGFEIFSILLVREIITSKARETELSIHKQYIADITSLFTTIRAQRHDFANHIQVLYIFAKQKNHERLLAYIEELVEQVKEINEVLVSDNPGLSALLQAKACQFKEKDIALNLQLFSSLTELDMRATEVNQIIGNLLDNAADAIELAGYPTQEIHLRTNRQESNTCIKVTNIRPVISADMQKKIFEYGFSTKPHHTGVGLAIVHSLVKKNGGTLSLISNEEHGTEFTITFPIKEGTKREQKTS
ncbi:sensor histidine kinase [Aneurinibacillus soli]|uniref:sensor histidine kinase n=1 Tax=Aneurinibacillus soli TaxID=1500254 RepID=UPI001560B564|nr:ATP-binding protein [Aneurinibacillus soli]